MRTKKARKVAAAALLMLVLMLMMSMGASAASKTVAVIGSENYTSLETALKEVKNGQTITLQSNVTVKNVIRIANGKKFKLNLNHKTVTTAKKSQLYLEKGNVTIYGGTIRGNDAFSLTAREKAVVTLKKGNYKCGILNYGKLTVSGGTYTGTDGGQTCFFNIGTMVINSGTFQNNRSDKKAGYNTRSVLLNFGKMTINGGTFKSTAKGMDMIGNFQKGQLTINRGTFSQTKRAILCTSDQAKTTVNGGTFKAGFCCAYNTTGTLTIKGGTFSLYEKGGEEPNPVAILSDNPKGTLKISGGTFTAKSKNSQVVYSKAVATISGGTFTSLTNEQDTLCINCADGKMTIKGGTFATTNSKYRGHTICVENGSLKMTKGTVKASRGTAIGVYRGKVTVTGGTLSSKKYSAIRLYERGGSASVGKKVAVKGLSKGMPMIERCY